MRTIIIALGLFQKKSAWTMCYGVTLRRASGWATSQGVAHAHRKSAGRMDRQGLRHIVEGGEAALVLSRLTAF
jgi:hypothetical protein